MKYNPKEISKKVPLLYNSKFATTTINIIETIEKELAMIAQYDDEIEVLNKYF